MICNLSIFLMCPHIRMYMYMYTCVAQVPGEIAGAKGSAVLMRCTYSQRDVFYVLCVLHSPLYCGAGMKCHHMT